MIDEPAASLDSDDLCAALEDPSLYEDADPALVAQALLDDGGMVH